MASVDEQNVYLCVICKEVYKCKSSATKHMFDVHKVRLLIPDKTPHERSLLIKHTSSVYSPTDLSRRTSKNDSEIPEKDSPHEERNVQCSLCGKRYMKRYSLYRHMREVHNIDTQLIYRNVRNSRLKCPDSSCTVSFYNRNGLREHIEKAHRIPILCSEMRFPTFNDFEIWKENMEIETNSRFVLQRKFTPDKKICYYACHRSGFFTSKGTGKRNNVTRKINGSCPATIDCIVTDKGVQVKFWETHFGHACEVDSLHLSNQERLEIANKLKEGVCFQKILDEVRDSLLKNDIRRIHLLKRRDLFNIRKSFKISNKENLIQKEPLDINTWIESMRALGDDCPIIFYKEKGVAKLKLRSCEFFLVIMTNLQEKMLICCDNNIVCIDCIFHINIFNYYLITLMTIDTYNVACPLAFCVTNRINEHTISRFYNCIKERVGTISANIFMSVNRPLFYTEWQNVMGSTDHQLLCMWDVDKNWRQKLEKLSVPVETKVRIYKKMRQIMQEERYAEFHSELKDTLNQFEEVDGLKEFASYIKTKYLETCELWASCYRPNSILHSSFILEQMHRTIYHCYMEGKNLSSIVRALDLVIEASREKVLEKLKKLPKEVQSELIGNSEQILENEEIEPVETIEDSKEEAPLIENNVFYVKHNAERICPSDCKPICSVCHLCFHKFTCKCTDNSLNICEHIQTAIILLKEQCTHVKEQCELLETKEKEIQNKASETSVVIGSKEMNTSDEGSRTVSFNNCVEQTEESVNEKDMEVDSENLQLLLLQKIECFQHIVKNDTCKPEKYAKINEYFDKIFELFTDEQ